MEMRWILLQVHFRHILFVWKPIIYVYVSRPVTIASFMI